VTKGDRDRIAASHQDTLDQGLAAVSEARHAREFRLPAPRSGPDLALQALLEPLHLAGRVDDRLLAGEERVAVAAHVYPELGPG
jgi:hypothetical protein